MDNLESYAGRLVRCLRCGGTLGQLLHHDNGPSLMYAASLRTPAAGAPWELKTAHKPKTDGLIALRPGAQEPESWIPADPNTPQGEVTHGTLIPLTDRVRCRCGFITSLPYLSERDFHPSSP